MAPDACLNRRALGPFSKYDEPGSMVSSHERKGIHQRRKVLLMRQSPYSQNNGAASIFEPRVRRLR
jgi:hypothetical protein